MSVTFLVDVDNTLVDNDRIREEMRERVAAVVGGGERAAPTCGRCSC